LLRIRTGVFIMELEGDDGGDAGPEAVSDDH
jgi:hypothetical protein